MTVAEVTKKIPKLQPCMVSHLTKEDAHPGTSNIGFLPEAGSAAKKLDELMRVPCHPAVGVVSENRSLSITLDAQHLKHM